MTTLAGLRTMISRDLRDPLNKTFDTTVVNDLINAAVAEVGRVAPLQFHDRLVPVANQLVYTVGSANCVPVIDPNPEVEVVRVELVDESATPDTVKALWVPASGEYANTTQAGWFVWNGKLRITEAMVRAVVPATDFIHVFGYSPYRKLTSDGQDSGMSNELEEAVRVVARIEAMYRLVIERDLFTQWQSASHASDVSPAALMNGLSLLQDDWRRRSRSIQKLRSPF